MNSARRSTSLAENWFSVQKAFSGGWCFPRNISPDCRLDNRNIKIRLPSRLHSSSCLPETLYLWAGAPHDLADHIIKYLTRIQGVIGQAAKCRSWQWPCLTSIGFQRRLPDHCNEYGRPTSWRMRSGEPPCLFSLSMRMCRVRVGSD